MATAAPIPPKRSGHRLVPILLFLGTAIAVFVVSRVEVPSHPKEYSHTVPGAHTHIVAPPVASASPVASVMPVAVSSVVLLVAIFVIIAKRFASTDKHWAFATVGTIVGYWLKG
jgi:hypothetical protein